MENSTQLLWRQQAALSGRRVLIVDADDPAQGGLPAAQVVLHADNITVGADQWAPLPVLPTGTDQPDLVIVPLPKSTERLEVLLRSLAGSVQAPLEVWLVGPAKGGIRGGVTRLGKYADQVTLLDSARHCKLYSARLRPAAALSLADVASTVEVDGLAVVSYPGVFGHGRLDDGSAMLLEALRDAPPTGAVLDVGCGNGVLSATLARMGCRVAGVDISATAVAAARETLARNGLGGHISGADLFEPQGERFQAIITNPPFHEGRSRTMSVARRLIQTAPLRLSNEGVLWMVANRELPYAQWLDQAFRQVRVVRESTRFRVYRAQR